MGFIKNVVMLVATAACVVLAEPPPPNSYLPPSNNQGYNYPKPSSPFPPAPRPSFTPPPPSYGPPVTSSFSPRPPTPSYGPPAISNTPRPTYGAPASNYPSSVQAPHGDHHDHHEPGMPYDFNYAVKDDYYGTDFSHNAVSDGDVVRGEYRVLLPDGRMQIVRYTADWKNGYNAEVTYEGGHPVYNPQGSNNNQLGQQYKPNGGY